MADEIEDVKQSPEPVIEPYYQAQAKNLIDTLFDLGLLSESLSRDGLDSIEGLVALHFQQIAQSSARCAGFAKRYKVLGRLKKDDDNRERHEEEMRWIARAKESENDVIVLADKLKKLTPWHNDTVSFLRKILAPPYCVDAGFASHLLNKAFELGLAERILGDEIRPTDDGCVYPPESPYPGMIPEFSRVSGGRKVDLGNVPRCGSMHSFNQCQRERGHEGCHQHRDGRHIEEWG
jgi:hypothetical protein